MVSTLDAAKRVLVVLLRTLAATYNCAVGVTRGVALSRLLAKPAQLLTHKFTQHALPRLPRSHGGWPGRVPVVNLIRVTTGQSLPESKLTISKEPPLPLESSNEPPLPLES